MIDTLTFPASRDPGMTIVRVGVDVGQRQDYSAIVVSEQEMRHDLPHFLVRSIERLQLATPYPLVVDRVEQVMQRLEAKALPRHGPRKFTVELLIDATGVGLPIADMLRERGLSPRVILFTGSDRINEQPQGVVSVGKSWMVSRLQVLLQSQRLHLPLTPEAGVLAKELQDFEVKVSESAHASFNAKSGSHDDLVVALGLSCGIERSAGRATSRSYLEPHLDQVRFAQRSRWVKRRLESQ